MQANPSHWWTTERGRQNESRLLPKNSDLSFKISKMSHQDLLSDDSESTEDFQDSNNLYQASDDFGTSSRHRHDRDFHHEYPEMAEDHEKDLRNFADANVGTRNIIGLIL